jgi:hypothetical protein
MMIVRVALIGYGYAGRTFQHHFDRFRSEVRACRY